MDCPKCGSAQEAGREECSACGIIFARWLERQQFPPVTPASPVETADTDAASTISRTALIAGVIAVVVFGVIWTAWRRAAREKPPSADLLDQINQGEMKRREELREERATMARARAPVPAPVPASTATTPPAASITFPSDFREQAVRDLLERCSYFTQKVTIEVPKTFERGQYANVVKHFPALTGAAHEQLVELEPPIDAGQAGAASPAPPSLARPTDPIIVRLTSSAYSKVDVLDTASTYRFGIGRRRIDTITGTRWPADTDVGSVEFDWTYERRPGNGMAADWEDHSGKATLRHTADGWTLIQLWINHRAGSVTVCP